FAPAPRPVRARGVRNLVRRRRRGSVASAFSSSSREAVLDLVVSVSRHAEPVRVGVAAGAAALLGGAGDLGAAPRVGDPASAGGAADADTSGSCLLAALSRSFPRASSVSFPVKPETLLR